MIDFRGPVLSCLALLACAGADTASVGALAREQAPDIYALIRRQPMIFFVAKGEPGACGPGCSEWIAAEGMIDPDAGQRLRDFVDGLQGRDLPIFFNSMGGLAGQAVSLGVVMREHRMIAGVGRTLPEGCRGRGAIDDACRRTIQSKREHKARLVTGSARCLSACVYALVGASVRRVARDAQLGVHTLRMPAGASPQGAQPSIANAHHLLKRYMIEMGVDSALIDVAAKVSADRVRMVSREEIARFGIEARDVYETPWTPYEDVSKRFYVLKAVTQATAADGTDFRTSLLRVGCKTGGRVPILLRRELLASETGLSSAVTVTVGDGTFALDGRLMRGTIEVRYGATGVEFFQNAITVPQIVIGEASTPAGNAPGPSRETRFSTKGLAKALDELQKGCGGSKASDDATLQH